jgi:hypothetical protein
MNRTITGGKRKFEMTQKEIDNQNARARYNYWKKKKFKMKIKAGTSKHLINQGLL